MTNFNTIANGSTFTVPSDADGVIYTRNADGSVSAENMITMTPEDADEAFKNLPLCVTSNA